MQRKWYVPVKRYRSTELEFSVSFRDAVVRTDATGLYVKTYRAGIIYPIVGLMKMDSGTFAVKMNDGYVVLGQTPDTFDVISRENGTGWTGIHDLAYVANYYNRRWRDEALYGRWEKPNGQRCAPHAKGSTMVCPPQPAYTTGTCELVKGKPQFVALYYTATAPLRTDAQSLLDTERSIDAGQRAIMRSVQLDTLARQAVERNRRDADQ